jgi:hypothetical protein
LMGQLYTAELNSDETRPIAAAQPTPDPGKPSFGPLGRTLQKPPIRGGLSQQTPFEGSSNCARSVASRTIGRKCGRRNCSVARGETALHRYFLRGSISFSLFTFYEPAMAVAQERNPLCVNLRKAQGLRPE